jgi:autotransporter-associated beta strand protein
VLGAKANWSTTHPLTLPAGGNITLKAADAADGPFNIGLNGIVSGAGGFTKTGAGTLSLSAANTFTGSVAIEAGTLRVGGSLASGGSVAVSGAGTLAGNGTIAKPIALNAGGTIAPDGATAIGVLSGASLTWNGGGRIAVDLAGSGTSDRLALSGACLRGTAGACEFALTPDASLAPGNTYTLVTFGSTNFTAGDFSASGLPPGYAASFAVGATSVQLTIVATPSITSPAAASGLYGASFSYTIAATNSPTSFSASGLPFGLTIDAASGVISGAPAASGIFNILLGASNLAGTASAPLVLTVQKAPAGVTLVNLTAT